MLSAKSLRMVPSAALAGLVAPITSRYLAMAFSPSSTCTTTGPEIMKSTRSLKKGRALCTPRSEEHTSELHSLMRISYAVFFLNKKHNENNKQDINNNDK